MTTLSIAVSPNGSISGMELALDAITKLVDSVAWPVALLATALVFRTPVTKLLNRVRRASYGDAEVEFERQLDEAESKIAKIDDGPKESEKEIADADFDRAINQSPELAILNAWIKIEDVVSKIAEGKGYTGPRARSFSYAFRRLVQDGVIGSDLAEIIRELRSLRNLVAHRVDGIDINADEALRFQTMSTVVAGRLSAIT
jgi:uncharacterized protein YutE (UPF0331/DUF86 family)